MKIIRRIFKWAFLAILSILIIIIVLLALDRDSKNVTLSEVEKQNFKAFPKYDPEVDSNHYFSLLKQFGKNKKLAKGFEYQCLLALSHYPELKDTPIDFLIQPAYIPLSSRPSPITVLFPWVKRKFWVVISDKSNTRFEPILLKNTPFNAQVGIIGHELAHSVYYLDKNSFQLAWIAYKYTKDRLFHRDFERQTDKRAIAHGLGYQLYDFAYYARKSFGRTDEEIAKDEGGGTYLSPNEIKREMEKYVFY